MIQIIELSPVQDVEFCRILFVEFIHLMASFKQNSKRLTHNNSIYNVVEFTRDWMSNHRATTMQRTVSIVTSCQTAAN